MENDGPRTRYAELRQQLAGIGYLSHGSVYRRPTGQSGTRFIWPTKMKARTVSLALFEAQVDLLEEAVTEHRRVKNPSPKCAASLGK